MGPAERLLTDLTGAGFTLRADAGRLLVSPVSLLTAGQREALRAHREALLALLAAPEGGDALAALPTPWENGGEASFPGGLYLVEVGDGPERVPATGEFLAWLGAHNGAARRRWDQGGEAKSRRK